MEITLVFESLVVVLRMRARLMQFSQDYVPKSTSESLRHVWAVTLLSISGALTEALAVCFALLDELAEMLYAFGTCLQCDLQTCNSARSNCG
jgi:hypothetical protein